MTQNTINSKQSFYAVERNEIKDRVRIYYENARDIAVFIPYFTCYKEHYILENGHIEKVLHKTLQAADVLEPLFAANDYGGLYAASVDRRTLEMMALYHDTGMDGNVDPLRYRTARDQYPADDSWFRRDHSMQSAIHVLRDRAFIQSKQVNPDEVALGCLLHSKSNSGVTNLADSLEWEAAVSRLKDAAAGFNEAHHRSTGIPPAISRDDDASSGAALFFDDSFIREADGTLSQRQLAVLRTECLCLRIGDANGHDCGSRTSQNGKPISFQLDSWDAAEGRLSEDLIRQIKAADSAGIREEVSHAAVLIDGIPLDEASDPGGTARMYALGEGNFKSLDLLPGPGGSVETIVLVKGDAYPLSAQRCIEERIQEWNTAITKPNGDMHRSGSMTVQDRKKALRQMQNRLPKVDITTCIVLGPVSEQTVQSYQAFAARIWHTYGLRVFLQY